MGLGNQHCKHGANWTSFAILSLNYLVTSAFEGLESGSSYKFRYRAKNKYGWGAYLEISTILAADNPKKVNNVETKIETNTSKSLGHIQMTVQLLLLNTAFT
jgi:hypothetical protein